MGTQIQGISHSDNQEKEIKAVYSAVKITIHFQDSFISHIITVAFTFSWDSASVAWLTMKTATMANQQIKGSFFIRSI